MSLGGPRSLGSVVLAGIAPGVGSSGFHLFISGIDRAGMLMKSSWSMQDDIGQRSTCSFKLYNPDNDYNPSTGEPVLATYGPTTLFRGSIETKQRGQGYEKKRRITIKAVDRTQVADRFFVAQVYDSVGQTADLIAIDILNTYLAGEGITQGQIDTGPLVSKAVYNYVRASDALNDLAEKSGFVWEIDQENRLNFRQRSSYAAPFGFSDTSKPYRNMVHDETRSFYRNRQFLIGGQATTDARTEEFKGDGTRKTFNLAFPVAMEPTAATVNGVAKTVGIKSVDTGLDWYWNRGQNEFVQDDGATAILSTDVLAVTYQGYVSIVAESENPTEFTTRAAVEGGTGVYEELEKDDTINDLDLAQEKIDGLLRRYAAISPQVTFETDILGLKSCMLMPIAVTEEDVDDEYLITSVKITFNESWSTDGVFRCSVKATSGEYLGGWAELLKKLFQRNKGIGINDSDVLQSVRSANEQIQFSDSINFVDALDDGSGDPYTIAMVGAATDDPTLQYGINKGNA